MRNFSILEIENQYKHNKRVDYIASCTSGWHLMNTLAFLNHLHIIKKRNLAGIIIICEHEMGIYMINESEYRIPDFLGVSFYKLPQNAKIDYGILSYKLNQNEDLNIISTFRPWVRMTTECKRIFKCKINNIIVDEGIGSYAYASLMYNIIRFYQQPDGIKKCAIYMIQNIISCFVLPILNIHVYKRLLLTKKRGRYIPNSFVIKDLKKVIGISKKHSLIFSPIVEYAILFTDPLKEQGCDNSTIESILKYYSKFVKECSYKGIKLYIKPHPREDINEYRKKGFDVIEDCLIIENFFSEITKKPKFVCGTYSTALITSKILYGIESYTLNKMIIKSNRIKDRKILRNMMKFEHYFNEIVPEFTYNCLN